MPNFLLVLHENPADSQSWTPEEMQQCIEKYRTWSEKLMAEDKLVRGQKLRDEGGRHLRPSGSGSSPEVTVADGPYAEVREVIGGLFEITATDYDEAAAIARTCPHLDNGWIEIRQIEETS
jgi:hypothetical protein